MVKVVKRNKYYWNKDTKTWQGLKDNATPLTLDECSDLKIKFPTDTYFVKVK